MIAVGQYGPDHVLGISMVPKDLGAKVGMLLGGRADLPVEIVEKTGDAPSLFVFSRLAGIAAHSRFDGIKVLHQRVGLDVPSQKFQRLIPVQSVTHNRSNANATEGLEFFRKVPRTLPKEAIC